MGKDYNIAKTSGKCGRCGNDLVAGEDFFAVVRQSEDEFCRDDYCDDCWNSLEDRPQVDAPDVFGIWQSRVQLRQEKRKLFVDNELLINFFERLSGSSDDLKVSFRYILALVLMRKKLLVYDRMKSKDNGMEIWEMHLKGNDQKHLVTDPKMDEEKIAQVSQQLGAIMEGEL